ncbi:MAG: redoxin domain-containing protein [Sumerlaeia bacterium]
MFSVQLSVQFSSFFAALQNTRKGFARSVLLIVAAVGLSIGLFSCRPIVLEDGASPNVELTSGVDPRNLENSPRRSPLVVGNAVPPLWLLDQAGREVSTREIVLGGDALLLFSPGDDSPEARALYQWVMKNKTRLSNMVEILIITPDSVERNAEISRREALGVALLHDPASYSSRVFGVLPSRSTPRLEHTWYALLAKENRILSMNEGLPEHTDVIMQLKVRPTGDDGGVLKLLSR